ncbi:amidohydrolase family protein [Candidatus Woesearchaeota archaeon]|nr:amidohydrolase family protein [Candidatus Woesearchaeota archaeon]
MKKVIIFSLSIFLLSILLAGCGTDDNSLNTENNRIGIDKITHDITQQEVNRITEERTKEITEKITNQMGGSIDTAPDCDRTPTKRQFASEPYYTGPLIDTHFHMPVTSEMVSNIAIQAGFEDMPHIGKIPTSKIICQMEKEGITKTFGFFMAPNRLLSQSVSNVKEIDQKYPGKIVSFFQSPLPLQQLFPDASEVNSVFTNNPGLYEGMGEVRFDFNGAQNDMPDGKYELEMYGLSDQHNLIVQLHPAKGQAEILKQVLEKYPHVIFLVHLMKDEQPEMIKLLETHDNMYYSLDAELNYIYGYQTIQNNNGPTKEEYVSFTKKNFDRLLDETLDRWKPVIEQHPDKFTWGTDRWFTWHFDEDVGALLEEFGRSFIGKLDPVVQEKFAYKNAEEMLAKR